MPNPITWIRSLFTKYVVTVESNQAIIQSVRHKQNLRNQDFITRRLTPPAMKTNLAVDVRFDPYLDIAISPHELLHAMGIITTPSVPNLAKLSATWAIIRYVWAFAPSLGNANQPLQLSTEARRIDFHQKNLLSDEVGMAMGYYVMTHYFGTPFWVDVKEALDDQTWNLSQLGKAMPDYIFFNDSFSTAYVVECKGNQTSFDSSCDQIRRGTEQVVSILFKSGRTISCMIIATYLAKDGTFTYIIDPPSGKDGNTDYHFPESSERIYKLKDDDSFISDARSISASQLLAYAGFWDEAISISPKKKSIKSKDIIPQRSRRIMEIEKFPFSGSYETHSTHDGNTIEIFTGLLSPLYQKITESKDPINRSLELPVPYMERFLVTENGHKRTGGFVHGSDLEKFETWSICSNGTAFHIKIT